MCEWERSENDEQLRRTWRPCTLGRLDRHTGRCADGRFAEPTGSHDAAGAGCAVESARPTQSSAETKRATPAGAPNDARRDRDARACRSRSDGSRCGPARRRAAGPHGAARGSAGQTALSRSPRSPFAKTSIRATRSAPLLRQPPRPNRDRAPEPTRSSLDDQLPDRRDDRNSQTCASARRW